MHFGTEAFRWRIADKATLRGINMMLGLGWLPLQLYHAFDDVSTPVFDGALVIVIPSHILDSVQFPLLKSLIIWHACHELLDAIPISEPCKTQSHLFYLQHDVIVRLHDLLLDPTLNIFEHFTRRKWVVGIVLKVHLKATPSVGFPWLSHVVTQHSTSAGV